MKKYYRVQPKGLALTRHLSRLGSNQVEGIFAFEKIQTLFHTYTWIHVAKDLGKYELVEFKGELLESPADSEGVVVKPIQILRRTPMIEWIASKLG